MAERSGFFNMGITNVGGLRGGDDDEEFDEEEIWAVIKDRTDSSPKVKKSKDSFSFSTPIGLPTSSRIIPRTKSSINGSSNKIHQQSAPVKIPDWSKIYMKNSEKQGSNNGYNNDLDYNYYYDDENGGIIPPHELIAKKVEMSQISSFSVCEGVGRTLKGRDLSIVRNAVLTRTGFLE